MNAPVIDPFLNEEWQGIETFLAENSSLVGRSVQSVETEYGIHIHHIHNCPVVAQTQRIAKPDLVLEAGMSLHVWGTWEALDRFLLQLAA